MRLLNTLSAVLGFTLIASAAHSQITKGKPFQALADAIQQNTALIEANSAQISDLSADFSELKADVARIDSELSTIKDQISANTQDLVDAYARIEAAVESVDSLTAELASLAETHRADIESIGAELDQIKLDLAGLAALSVSLAESLDNLVATHGDDIQSISVELQQLNASLSLVNAQYINLSATQQILAGSLDDFSALLAAFDASLADLAVRVDALESEPNPQLTYSDTFSGTITSDYTQRWEDFLVALEADRIDGRAYQSIEIFSSLANPIRCLNSSFATLVARNLGLGVVSTTLCDGYYWTTGTCNTTELKVSTVSSPVCRCDENASIRPYPGSNWGGFGSLVGGAGSTCQAPQQTLGVTLKY